MAQGDYLIQNQSFPSFRSDLNSTLEAINTSNSGTSRPTSAVAGTVWLDTTNATNPTLKFYDGTDDISLAQFDYSANTVNWLDSTVVADFNLVDDTTPQLGGNLDVNGNSIVSVSNGNITFTPDGTGKVIIDGLSYPTADGTSGQNLITDGAGNLSFSNVIPADNTVSLAKLTATGTKDATTFLRGDNSFAEVPAGGITEADMWRTTASTSGGTGVFSSNWERVDTYDFSHLGTGMSQASGIFTFPSTGIWRVAFQSNFTGLALQYAGLIIAITTDNSTYNQHVKSYTNLDGSSDEAMVHIEGIVDIRNTTTHKVRFEQQQSASGGSWAGGDSNRTSATFIRLGDT